MSIGDFPGVIPSVTSPSGRIRVQVLIKDQGERYSREPGCLFYRVEWDGEVAIEDSRLGLVLLGQPSLTAAFALEDAVIETGRAEWEPVFGERSRVAVEYRDLTVCVVETIPPHRNMVVQVRVFDQGFALRYVPDEEANGRAVQVIGDELTEFAFPEGCQAYQQRWPEDEYRLLPIAELAQDTERPLTVVYPSGVSAVVAEAANVDESRMLLGPSRNGILRVRRSGPIDPGQSEHRSWRVVQFADVPADLIGRSHLLEALCPDTLPGAMTRQDASWIRPGKAIREVTLSTSGGKACIDFAAAHGLQYILYDAGWYGFEYDETADARAVSLDRERVAGIPDHDGLDLEEVIRYGKQRGIGVFLYVNRRALERQLDDLLPLYASWGVAGIKFGFVNVGPQEWTRWLHNAVAKCAEHRLLVDIHDYYRPTGLSRTWPNLLTQEGTRGNEHFPTPRHNVTLPFTRFTAGAADYTICYRHPRLQTTDAHQLAMAAVYYSPLQLIYWYMRPSDYVDLPELEWFDRVPTVWDETLGIDGRIGEYVTVARRRGEAWFVGAMTNEKARRIAVPLSFLSPERKYRASIFRDDSAPGLPASRIAIERREVSSLDVLTEDLAAAGGVAIHISPV